MGPSAAWCAAAAPVYSPSDFIIKWTCRLVSGACRCGDQAWVDGLKNENIAFRLDLGPTFYEVNDVADPGSRDPRWGLKQGLTSWEGVLTPGLVEIYGAVWSDVMAQTADVGKPTPEVRGPRMQGVAAFQLSFILVRAAGKQGGFLGCSLGQYFTLSSGLGIVFFWRRGDLIGPARGWNAQGCLTPSLL